VPEWVCVKQGDYFQPFFLLVFAAASMCQVKVWNK
jgi:hypothetical protein